MPKHPPVDGAFYEWGTKVGMSEEEIASDWEAYCDGLVQFHEEISLVMGEPVSTPSICVGGSE